MRLRRIGVFIATCAYVGYAPLAPGTFGSVIGLALFYAIRHSGSTTVELVAIALVVAIGLWSSTEAEHHFGGIDPGPIVIDEVAGMLITLALVPVGTLGVVAGFLLFRILDVVKPWPARRLELLPGGLGVMADDCVVAVYGNLVMHALVWQLPAWLT
jgi:phosphatidylglycerophosphatase A